MKNFKSRYEMRASEFEFICEFIKLRRELGLTQQQMADKSNVLRDKIAKIEGGFFTPTLKSLSNILEPLGYRVTITKIKK